MRLIAPLLFAVLLLMTGCMRYLTHDRSEVLLPGLDMDQTLKVAKVTMAEDRWGSVLTVWAIRDQQFTPEQAQVVANLYFEHIDRLHRRFNIWHLTWAIADIYRLGDEGVKQVMHNAYEDATARAAELHNLADKHANGEKLYFGDAHWGGRRYAKKHLVIPGNTRGYLQSYDEFVKGRD
ncbi:MAG: hypothetical protein GF398_06695 [Chitinivibrionales bacterium]|nr:hypothetical protein [Chitinivibrionales bacterium]